MKLLLVTNIFPPDIGGPASFIDRLGHALAADNHRVTVVCTSDQRRVAEDAQRPFRVWRIPRRNQLEYHARLRSTLLTALLAHRRCLINGLEDHAGPLAGRVGCRYLVKIVGDSAWQQGRNRGVISTSIDEFQAQTDVPNDLQAMQRRRAAWLSGARGVIVPSQYLRGLVRGWGVPDERIHVILNGVPLEQYSACDSASPNGKTLRVAFVGRLTNWKGVETLLLALSRTEHVRAEIIGDGPAEPLLRGLAAQLNLGTRARFTGRLDPAAVRNHLTQAHALVLTSSYEGLSHTLLEAGALGLPCIASDCGGNPEVIRDGDNGLLVPYGNVAALAAALQQLQSNEQQRKQMAIAARSRAADFAFSRTVERTSELLCQL